MSNDGLLTLDEIYRNVPDVDPDSENEDIFDAIDVNQDGQINKDDIINYLMLS